MSDLLFNLKVRKLTLSSYYYQVTGLPTDCANSSVNNELELV